MENFIAKFILGYTELCKKHRYNSKHFNRNMKEFKYLRLHPVIIPARQDKPEHLDFMVQYCNECTATYPVGEDLQREAYDAFRSDGWHEFINANTTPEEEEMFNETFYIETSRFSPIEVIVPTWDDLLNSPKLKDADLSILKDAFEDFHRIKDDYEATQDLWKLFNNNEKQPKSLELRVVYEDVDSDGKYGEITVLLFWKNTFVGVGSVSYNRYRESVSWYVSNTEYWTEIMTELYARAEIPSAPNSVPGAELLDMNVSPEEFVSVPGFCENCYSED